MSGILAGLGVALALAFCFLVLSGLLTIAERLRVLLDYTDRLVNIAADQAERERQAAVKDAALIDAARAMRPQG